MADTRLIHFDPAADLHTWSTVNDAGELTSKIVSGTLQEFAEQSGSDRIVVLLDNTVMHLNRLDMPAMSPQKMLRAIPFALEDQLADDVEDMHFVFTRDDRAGHVAVAAIARDTLQGILDMFAELSLTPTSILPDCLCLAANDEQWCVLHHGSQANFQHGQYIGNEYDSELFDTVLSAELAASEDKPARLLVFGLEGEALPDHSAVIGEDTEIVPVSYNSHPIVVYCGHYKQALPLNLLQHDFKPVSTRSIAWRRWSIAAALALVWLCANLGVSAWQLHQLEAENEALYAETIDVYRKAFPKSTRIVNPRVQMEQKLKELRAGGSSASSSIVSLLSSSATILAQDKSIEVINLSYRNGRLDVTLNTKNLNSIQSLNTRLNQTEGIRSEILSSSSEKDLVKGSLRIQQASS